MDPRNYHAAKTFSAKTFDPKILLEQKPGRVDPWARTYNLPPSGRNRNSR